MATVMLLMVSSQSQYVLNISKVVYKYPLILFSKFLGNLNNKNGFFDNNYVNTIDLDEEMGN